MHTLCMCTCTMQTHTQITTQDHNPSGSKQQRMSGGPITGEGTQPTTAVKRASAPSSVMPPPGGFMQDGTGHQDREPPAGGQERDWERERDGGARTNSGQQQQDSRKRSLSDVYGHQHQGRSGRIKPRRKHRNNSPRRSVGSGASSSGFHAGGGGDRSGGEEANCPKVAAQQQQQQRGGSGGGGGGGVFGDGVVLKTEQQDTASSGGSLKHKYLRSVKEQQMAALQGREGDQEKDRGGNNGSRSMGTGSSGRNGGTSNEVRCH